MLVNQGQTHKFISEGRKHLEVLKERKYLELSKGEKAALKTFFNKLRAEVKAYQSPNADLSAVYKELDVVLDGQEGFFWEYVS